MRQQEAERAFIVKQEAVAASGPEGEVCLKLPVNLTDGSQSDSK